MKTTIKSINVKNKKVLLRVDFNVPIKNGVITDDNRIVQALPTIKHLINENASVIIISHLGRPDGEFNLKYSLKPCAERLSELLNQEVLFSEDVVGKQAIELSQNILPGQILMLENLRFMPEEEENDDKFAEQLASLADIFVFDAFGTAHRKHASTYGVAKLLPNAIGFLVEKEIEMITKNIEQPQRPFTAILGGAKVSDKIGVIKNLMKSADNILVGGAMAYTLLKAQNVSVGKSMVEDDMLQTAKEILHLAQTKGVNLVLPADHVVVDSFNNYKNIEINEGQIKDNLMGLDIGPETINNFSEVIKKSKLIIWNGPMGVFEDKNFENGTKSIVEAVADSNATSIIGGGDSAAAVIKFGYDNKISHISTGGGASLKLIEGKTLPALEVINEL